MAKDVQAVRAATEFLNAVKNKESDDKLKEILAKNPKLLESKEFAKKVFPKASKNKNMGLVPLDDMVETVKRVKGLADKGMITSEQLNSFLDTKHPMTGETFATFTAKQAIAACDKANSERTVDNNGSKVGFTDSDRKIFMDNQATYTAQLEELKNLGVSMEADGKGVTVDAIAKAGKIKDEDGNSPAISGKQAYSMQNTANSQSQTPQEALHVNVAESEGLEIGGEEKTPIKINVKENPVKVNIQPQKKEENEDINEATVEDAPEDEKSKNDYKGERIKEQDIIDYMYNEWFLAAASYCLNKVVSKACDGVDYLCDSSNSRMKKRNKDKEEKHQGKIGDFKKNGEYLLGEGVAKLKDNYKNLSSDNFAKWQDVAANLGKNPQTWTKMNPKNPKDKKLIDMVNKEYKENPQGCKDKIDNLVKNYDKTQKYAASIYGLAAEMAATEIAYEGMDNGKLKRATKGEKNIGDLSQEQIDEKLNKRTAEKCKEIQDTIESANLAIELKAARERITNKEAIKQQQAEFTAAYIGKLAKQTMDCKANLTNDLDKGNFKYADKSVSKETTDSYKKMQKLTNLDKLSEAVLTQTHKKVTSYDLQADAKERFSPSALDDMYGQFKEKAASHQFSQEQHDKRKAAFDKWKEKANKGFDKVLNNENSIFNQIYNNRTQGR